MPVGICTSIPLARVIVHERKQLRKVEGGSPGLLFEQDQPIKNPILVSAKHKYFQSNELRHQCQRKAKVLERNFSVGDFKIQIWKLTRRRRMSMTRGSDSWRHCWGGLRQDGVSIHDENRA